MMKIFGRAFIILIAAGLIALGWYVFSTTSASQMMEPPDRPAEFSQMDGQTDEMSEDRPARPEGEEMGFSLSRILTGLVVTIGEFALVIVLVALLRKLVNRFTSTPFFKLAWFKR